MNDAIKKLAAAIEWANERRLTRGPLNPCDDFFFEKTPCPDCGGQGKVEGDIIPSGPHITGACLGGPKYTRRPNVVGVKWKDMRTKYTCSTCKGTGQGKSAAEAVLAEYRRIQQELKDRPLDPAGLSCAVRALNAAHRDERRAIKRAEAAEAERDALRAEVERLRVPVDIAWDER